MSKTLKFLNSALVDLELKCVVNAHLYFDDFMVDENTEKEIGQDFLAYKECESLILVLNRIHELCLLLRESPLEFAYYQEIENLISGKASVTGQTKFKIFQPLSDNLLRHLEKMPDSNFSFKLNASEAQKVNTANRYTTEVDWEIDPMAELQQNYSVVETLKVFEVEMAALLQLTKERQPAEELLASCFG